MELKWLFLCLWGSKINSRLHIFRVNHSNQWAVSLGFKSSWVADVVWSILQHRVLVSAAYISPASLVPPPAHTTDDDNTDDDSGHHRDDDEDDRSVIRNRSLLPLSTAGDLLVLWGWGGLDSRWGSASSGWRGMGFPPLLGWGHHRLLSRAERHQVLICQQSNYLTIQTKRCFTDHKSLVDLGWVLFQPFPKWENILVTPPWVLLQEYFLCYSEGI